MAVLQSTNVQGALCVNGVAVGGSKDFKFCCFTGSSTFTPSQDLVDGNGFIATDIVAGGGGAGARSIVGACFKAAIAGIANCFDANPAPGGFIQNPHSPITATTDCTVTIGAGGAQGTATHPSEFYLADCQCMKDFSSSLAGGAAGGDSAFGSNIAYGGKGGNTVECIQIGSNFGGTRSRSADGGAPNAAVPTYAGKSTDIFSVESGYSVSGKNCFDIAGASGIGGPNCLQWGGSDYGGKCGASGLRCANGFSSVGQLGFCRCFGQTLQSTVDYACNSTNTFFGFFCDCTNQSGSVFGDPGGWGCVCMGMSFYASCRRKSAISSSNGPGAPGIVVLQWSE